MGLFGLIAGGIMDANKAVKQKQAQKDDSVQTVVVDNRYSIDVPSFYHQQIKTKKPHCSILAELLMFHFKSLMSQNRDLLSLLKN